MATTYKLISKSLLSSNAADVTFNSIPSTYDDILIIASVRSAYSGQLIDSLRLQFNSDTGSNYSTSWLTGNGSSAAGQGFSGTNLLTGYIAATNTTANAFSNVRIYIANYAGSGTKSILSTAAHETKSATAYSSINASVWNSVNQITSIKCFANNANLVTNSSLYLYGIKK